MYVHSRDCCIFSWFHETSVNVLCYLRSNSVEIPCLIYKFMCLLVGIIFSVFTVVNKGGIFWEKEANKCCPGLAATVLI